jgi:hypothetical protein
MVFVSGSEQLRLFTSIKETIAWKGVTLPEITISNEGTSSQTIQALDDTLDEVPGFTRGQANNIMVSATIFCGSSLSCITTM